jgi:hypothetical protein
MMRRGILAARSLAAVGGVAMLLGACGGSSPKPVATVPAAALTRAADISSGASGYKMAMTVRETLGAERILTTGSGSFSVTTHSGAMVTQTSLPASVGNGAPSSLREQVVINGGTVYMKLPPVITSKLPGGKPWLELNLAALGQKAGLPGLSSVTGGTSSTTNPGQFLEYLRATSGGSVENLGPATINGIKTTRYHAEIDLARVPNAVPKAFRKGAEQFVAALQKKFKAGNMPVDAWIDSAHLVRRIALNFTEQVPSSSQQVNLAMQVNFISYGPQPTPAIPPASQTTNLLTLLHGAL